jgi:REP element-mobilizing transposase RayT
MTNATIKGVIARAQARVGMRVCAVVAASNHMHLLVIPDSEEQLADFMGLVNGVIARKVGQLHGWRQKLWSRRYVAAPVSDEEAAQVGRLHYILSHGPKENLVEHPADWPGVHVVAELSRGDTDVHGGLWRDQTEEYEARRRAGAQRRPPNSSDFVTRESFQLSPLPCWAHRDRREVAENIRQLVDAIVSEHRERRRAEGATCLGTRRIAAQGPFDQPRTSKRSPAPLCHAASREARARMITAYKEFVAAYRLAVERLRAGISPAEAGFPQGCFPPGLPFVPLLRAGPFG